MPELPEVEDFRQLLLPFVSSSSKNDNEDNNNNDKNNQNNYLHLERLNLDKKPPRKFLSDEDIQNINQQQFVVKDVLRRGKLICMVLESTTKKKSKPTTTTTTSTIKYLYIHMGMTGRISTSSKVPNLIELKKDSDYPPPHTYLKFSTTTNNHEACFSDPRKFGSILLQDNKDEFDSLAPDALTEIITDDDDDEEETTTNNNDDDDNNKKEKQETTTSAQLTPTTTIKSEIITKLTNQSMGIKALLLDQKRVVSGVGNWVADEVLYQTQIHPDQNYLLEEESLIVITRLHMILKTAVDCLLSQKNEFPKEWLFHYRWNSKQTTKDFHGKTVTFITSGGRTSAIVPSIQKKKGRKKQATTAPNKTTRTTATRTKKKRRKEEADEEPEAAALDVYWTPPPPTTMKQTKSQRQKRSRK